MTDEEWNLSSKNVFCYIKSPFWQEYAWKLLVRFFITPLKISKFTDKMQKCWRMCGEYNVDLVHILYACSRIKPYWEGVIDFIKRICGQNIKLEKHHFMLGIPPKSLNKNNNYIFWVLRITALKQITRNWKEMESPSLKKWFELIECLYENEKITHKMNGKIKLFKTKWLAYTNQIY